VNPDPGFSMTDKPQAVILAMGTADYFDLMAELMGEAAPPAKEDTPIVARMAKIGIVPGKPFEMDAFDSAVQAALKDLPQEASSRRFRTPMRCSSVRSTSRCCCCCSA
jgi:hypothetical protein